MLVNAKSKEARDSGLGGGDLYSNFHCDYDEEGAYLHDSRYDRLITRADLGIHRVRLIHCTYLVRVDVIPKIDYLLNPYNYEYRNFTISAEQNGVPQYLDNRIPYGALTLMDDPEVSEALLKDFELLARPNQVVYKILHAGNDENRRANHRNLDRLFGKYFHRLSAKTQYLSSLEDTRNYLSSNSDLKILDNLDYESWLPGAIGIWASWKNALNVFTKSNSAALILIEDDLWVTEEFVSKRILNAVQELPSGWDYLTLYTPESQRNIFTDEHDEGLQFACRPYHTWSTAAVIISQLGAVKLLKHMSEGVSQNIDLFLYAGKNLQINGFALKPLVMRDSISVFTNWKSMVGLAHEGKRYTRLELYDTTN